MRGVYMKQVYAVEDQSLKIYVGRGKKGARDFIVYVKTHSGAVPPFISDPEGRPRHIEWVNLYRDFYRFSRSRNPRFSKRTLASLPFKLATSTFVRPIEEANALPVPRAVYSEPYRSLLEAVERHIGRYEQAPLDFIVTLLELLFIQEATNYPTGVLHILLPKMLEAELLGSLPQNAARTGETLQSLRGAVTLIARWEDRDTAMRLLRKWKEFFSI